MALESIIKACENVAKLGVILNVKIVDRPAQESSLTLDVVGFLNPTTGKITFPLDHKTLININNDSNIDYGYVWDTQRTWFNKKTNFG